MNNGGDKCPFCNTIVHCNYGIVVNAELSIHFYIQLHISDGLDVNFLSVVANMIVELTISKSNNHVIFQTFTYNCSTILRLLGKYYTKPMNR